MTDKLTREERSLVEHIRQEFTPSPTGLSLLAIIDRLAPKPPKLVLVRSEKEPK